VSSLALQSDGKVLLSGIFTAVNGAARNLVARLNTNGSLDATFNPGAGPNANVLRVAAQADGHVVIAGLFSTVNGTNRNHVARLNANGTLDLGFDPGSGPDRYPYLLALQSDGKVLIGGGGFTNVAGTWRNGIARLNSDGSVDQSFDPGPGPG